MKAEKTCFQTQAIGENGATINFTALLSFKSWTWKENEEEKAVNTYLLFIAGLHIQIAKFFMIVILIEKIFERILLLMLTELHTYTK